MYTIGPISYGPPYYLRHDKYIYMLLSLGLGRYVF